MNNNKIKVLVLFPFVKVYGMERANTTVFYLLKEYGVDSLFVIAPWSVKELAPELEKNNLNYIVARFGGLIYKSQSLKEKLISIINFFINAKDLRNIIKTFGPDYIYISSELSFVVSTITLIAHRIPLIYRMGDEPIDYKIYFRLFRKYINKRVTKYVVNSKFIKDKLLLTGCKENKIKLIYSYPPVRINNNVKSNLPQFNKDSFIVLYVGQLSERKGVRLLFEAAELLLSKYKDMVFIFAGEADCNDKFYKDLINRKKLIKENDRLIFTGYVENVDSLFLISSLHICPSTYEEPLANVVIEAKKNAVLSIVFRSGGLPELIEHLEDGYICEKKTVDELVKAIIYFYLRQDEMKQCKEEANKSLVKLGITKENFINKWLEVFEY